MDDKNILQDSFKEVIPTSADTDNSLSNVGAVSDQPESAEQETLTPEATLPETMAEEAVETAKPSDGDIAADAQFSADRSAAKNQTELKITEPIFTDDAPEKAYDVKFSARRGGATVNLILSVLGLLLSVLVFPGIVLSLIGLIGSIKGLKVQNSQSNTWAFWIGLLATLVNLFMIVCFIIFAVS